MKTATQKAVSEIAGILLELEVDSRIPTFFEFNKKLNLGFGTLQNALGILQSKAAVSTSARGHKGTFITSLNYALLWRFAELDPLHFLTPFPNAVGFRGLASGFRQALDALEVRARIDYEPGAAKRLDAVREGRCDGCLVSGISAQAVADDHNLLTLHLDPAQYYPPGSVTLLTTQDALRQDLPGGRVAIDRSSVDHRRLSMAEFGDDVGTIFVDCEARDFLSVLLRGEVDRLVWHQVDIGLDPRLLPICQFPLFKPLTVSLLEQGRRAALVLPRTRRGLAHLLGGLDMSIIATVQNDAFVRERARSLI